jgi:hypothetical protein
VKQRDFLIIIPVADRPRQLQLCLQSLFALCEIQGEGRRVGALILEDSMSEAKRLAHEQICKDFSQRGLVCHYLGLEDQYELQQSCPGKTALESLLGNEPWPWPGHKGASITRNLGYLKLLQLAAGYQDPLFWFVDSDQEFLVLEEGGQTRQLPYFSELERLFADQELRILTGKVVGDPPVSPAVMAGTCLEDLLVFLTRLAATRPEAPCSFHGQEQRNATDAAYHDLAGLFGFAAQEAPFAYECPLEGSHDHRACLAQASHLLAAFFDGVHPTRRSWYQPDSGPLETQPARTLYTGNYVMDARGLEYAIPFAQLKLRMAGPTLGRLLRAEFGAGFASANLPLLHRRALEEEARAECRPGVDWQSLDVDMSGEFQRQFLGDWMLFTVEQLAQQGYPGQLPDTQALDKLLSGVREDLIHKYARQAEANLRLAAEVRRLWEAPGSWWNSEGLNVEVQQQMTAFVANIERTFRQQGPLLANQAFLDDWQTRLKGSLLDYPAIRQGWRRSISG